MTVAIVRYNAGNIHSVATAMDRLGAEYVVTDDPSTLRAARRVIFPGVGEASSAMTYLRDRKLDDVLRSLTNPVLGICLGLQLLCSKSEENQTECLGLVDTEVRRFTKARKVPHMGWSRLRHQNHPLFTGIHQDAYFYFVHSYAAQVTKNAIATCVYEEEFAAAVASGNFFGVQFHPEKSGEFGQKILENFLSQELT